MIEDQESNEKNQPALVKAFDELLKRYLLFFEMFDLLSTEFTIPSDQKAEALPLSKCLITCEEQYNLEQKNPQSLLSLFTNSNTNTSTDGYLVNRYINHLQQVINKLYPTIPILLKLLSAHYQLLLWATLSDPTLIETKKFNHKSLLFSSFNPETFKSFAEMLKEKKIENENWLREIQNFSQGVDYYKKISFTEKEKHKINSILNENKKLQEKFKQDIGFKNFSAEEFQQAVKLLKEAELENLTKSENGKLLEKIELAENCLLSFQNLAFPNETVEQIKKQIGSENSNESLANQIQITSVPEEADIIWASVKEYCLNAIDLQDKALILMRMARDKENSSEKLKFDAEEFIAAIGLPKVLQKSILKFAEKQILEENISPKAQVKKIIEAYFEGSNYTSIEIKKLKKSLNENIEQNLSKYLEHWAFLFNDPANEQFLINVACTDIGRETSEVTILEKILKKTGQQPKFPSFFSLFYSGLMKFQLPMTEILKKCTGNTLNFENFNFSELFQAYNKKLNVYLETANQINTFITEIYKAVNQFLENLAQIDHKEEFLKRLMKINHSSEFSKTISKNTKKNEPVKPDVSFYLMKNITLLRKKIDELADIIKQYHPYPVLVDRKLKEISQRLILPTFFPEGLGEYANPTLYPAISMVLAFIHTGLENIIGPDVIIQQKTQLIQLLALDKIARQTTKQKQQEEINFEQQINMYYHTIQITPVRLIDHVFSMLTNYFEFPSQSKLKNLAAFFQQARKRILKYQQYYIEEIAFNSKYEKTLILGEQEQTANNLLLEFSILPEIMQKTNSVDLLENFNQEISDPKNIELYTPGEVFLAKVDLLEFLLELTVNKTENPEKLIQAWIEERQLILDLQKEITQFLTPLALTDPEKIGSTSFPTSDKSYKTACELLEKLSNLKFPHHCTLKFPHHFYRLQHLANHWLLPAANLQDAFLEVPSLAKARKLLNQAEKQNLAPHKLLQLKLKLVFLAYASFKFVKEVIDKAVYETFFDEEKPNLDKIIKYCGESEAPIDPVKGSYEMKAENFLSSFKGSSHSSISTNLSQLQISNENSTEENERIEIIFDSPIQNKPPQSKNSSSNPSKEFSINNDSGSKN